MSALGRILEPDYQYLKLIVFILSIVILHSLRREPWRPHSRRDLIDVMRLGSVCGRLRRGRIHSGVESCRQGTGARNGSHAMIGTSLRPSHQPMLELLVLVIAANSAPVLARHVFGTRFAAPLDGGRVLRDGRPVLGRSKTWRGLIAGTLASAALAPLLGLAPELGLATGGLALGGDLLASFFKRRRGYPASARAPLLDTQPEVLFPAVVLRSAYGMSWLEVAAAALGFHLLVRLSSPLLYRLRLRRRPW